MEIPGICESSELVKVFTAVQGRLMIIEGGCGCIKL